MRTVIATSLDAMGVEGTREQGLFLGSLACEVGRATPHYKVERERRWYLVSGLLSQL